MNQRRMDQLIVQAKRRHKKKMEKLSLAFLGKRAEAAPPAPQKQKGASYA